MRLSAIRPAQHKKCAMNSKFLPLDAVGWLPRVYAASPLGHLFNLAEAGRAAGVSQSATHRVLRRLLRETPPCPEETQLVWVPGAGGHYCFEAGEW